MRSLGELPRGACPLFLRRGFTLVELLVTMTIITILAGMITFAMYRVQEMSRIEKTQALIARLNNIIMDRWDSYRTRRVPVTIDPSVAQRPRAAAIARLNALHELMRLELPDRWSDVVDKPVASATIPRTNPVTPIQLPSVSREYRRRFRDVTGVDPDTASPAAIDQAVQDHAGFEDAECLYLIVMASVPDDASPRDLFSPGEIGDVDGDGFHEFIDAWGTQIGFLRWAPGFNSELQPLTDTALMTFPGFASADEFFKSPSVNKKRPAQWGDPFEQHDPFDPLRLQPEAFALTPLIYSAGPNKHFNIVSGYKESFRYSQATPVPNDPYYIDANKPLFPIGSVELIDSDRLDEYLDNIHNHLLGVRQ